MKKLFFTAALAVTMLAGFSSCKKCQVCTKSNSNEVRVCEKDYNGSTAYGLALDVYEAGGYVCKSSI